MIPTKTSVDDIEKLLSYLTKQIGWVELDKIRKTLNKIDDRNIGSMVALGLIQRDSGNVKPTEVGQTFASGDQAAALRSVIAGNSLYLATIEWIHYGEKKEAAAIEIGQYWENKHRDTLGEVKGSTLKDGAICFSRVAEGAGFGEFKIGRGGKETRLTPDLKVIESFLAGVSAQPVLDDETPVAGEEPASNLAGHESGQLQTMQPPVSVPSPPVHLSTSPSVHVNVEIHIAADATADTVREIFKNMARYVLGKPDVEHDG
jgi:hypothetical protein